MTATELTRSAGWIGLLLALLAASAPGNGGGPQAPPPGVPGRPAMSRPDRARGFAALNERLRPPSISKEAELKRGLARAVTPIAPNDSPSRVQRRYDPTQMSEDDARAMLMLGVGADPFGLGLMLPIRGRGEAMGGVDYQKAGTAEFPAPAFPPDSAQKLLIVGDLAFRKGLFPRALTAYERAAAMEMESVAAQLAVAEATIPTHQYRRGGEIVELVLRRGPSVMRATIDRSGLYPSPRRLESAITELKQHCLDHRDDAQAMLLLAYVLTTEEKEPGQARLAVRAVSELLGAGDAAVNTLAKKLGMTKD